MLIDTLEHTGLLLEMRLGFARGEIWWVEEESCTLSVKGHIKLP